MSHSFRVKVSISDDDLYALYEKNGWNASALAGTLQCDPASARKRVAKMLARRSAHPIAEAHDSELVNRVAELLKKANVDPLAISRLRNVKFKSYGVGIKNAEGRFEQHGLHSTSFEADPILSESDNPCLTQAPPITVLYADVPRIVRKLRVLVIISDAQIGFIRGPHGLESIHDPVAVDVAQQIVAAEQPAGLYQIGDLLDMTQLSRWPQHPEFDGCLQASIDAGSRILGEFVSAAGPQCTERLVISGNHDIRAERYALQNAKAFLGLRRANALPDEWPVASMPFLLRFEDLGVSYHAHYPGDVHWLLDDLLLTHEAPKKLEFAASIIHGHDHKLTQDTDAQYGRFGRPNYFRYSIGCICHVGSRTSDPSTLMQSRVPSNRPRNTWAQGICVVEILEGKIPLHQVTQTRINDGVALHRGEVFRATDESRKAA